MDASTLYMIGSGMQIAGSLSKGQAAYAEGKSRKETAEYTARGHERIAGEERAVGSREAYDERAKAAQLKGKQVAIGAASGASMDSASIVDLITEAEALGSYRSKDAIARRESRARGHEDQAAVARAEGEAAEERGKNARIASIFEALGGAAGAGYGYTQKFPSKRRRVGFSADDEEYEYAPEYLK